MKRTTAILSAILLIMSFLFAACGSSDIAVPEHFPIGAGFLRSFAIDENGSVYYWGIDPGSEDTLGTEELSTVPEHLVTVPEAVESDVSSVFVSDCSALFLKNDRSLWLLATPALTGDFCAPEATKLMNNVISADLSSTDILAVDESGTLWSFKNSLTEPEKLLDSVSFVSAYSSVVLAAKTDGTVEGWGSNALGSLCSTDLSLTGPQSIPVSSVISPR